jgi:hypothetical protein
VAFYIKLVITTKNTWLQLSPNNHLNFHFFIKFSKSRTKASSIEVPKFKAAFIFWRKVISLTMLTIRERAWAATDEDIETLTGGGKRPISKKEECQETMIQNK